MFWGCSGGAPTVLGEGLKKLKLWGCSGMFWGSGDVSGRVMGMFIMRLKPVRVLLCPQTKDIFNNSILDAH